MKRDIENIIKDYLSVFEDERDRLHLINDFIKESSNSSLIDYNNLLGHLTVGTIVYSFKTDELLVLYHKDLNMYMYPGGHIDKEDKNMLEAALREVKEETGIKDFQLFHVLENKIIPFDIDIHKIPFNKRVNMEEHYHFDFRYLILIDDYFDVNIDKNELSSYMWVSSKELENDEIFSIIVRKIKFLLEKVK